MEDEEKKHVFNQEKNGLRHVFMSKSFSSSSLSACALGQAVKE